MFEKLIYIVNAKMFIYFIQSTFFFSKHGYLYMYFANIC